MEKKQIEMPQIIGEQTASLINEAALNYSSTKTVKELVEILGVKDAKEIINKLLAKYE